MLAATHRRALRWFRITLGIGMVPNVVFALFALFAPGTLARLGDLGGVGRVHWPQTAGVLLLIVTAMYVPAIKDPRRYLPIAWTLVAGRFAAGSLFLIGLLFMGYPTGVRVHAVHDLALSCIQAMLLCIALRNGMGTHR